MNQIETNDHQKKDDETITMNNDGFGISLDTLKELMQLKTTDLIDKLNQKYNGIQGLAVRLKTNLQTGLNNDPIDLQKRQKIFGKNEIPPKAAKSIFRLAYEALQDTTLIMLVICSIVSIGLSFYHPEAEVRDEEYKDVAKEEANIEWVEGVAILIAVMVVVAVTAFNDWRKEKQFRGLQNRIEGDHMAHVIRKGTVVQVVIKDLVVGDICCIKYGDSIPADGIVVQSSDLKIDESSLTGETDLIKKDPNDSISILSGKKIK
jgi:P-type Ca2+ transporter type 2B